MATTDTSRRPPLDRAAIVRAGVRLADTEGVAVLTMRRVADELGFKAMALYNHISSKDELLEAMVDSVAAEIAEPSTDREPLVAVRDHAIATRDAFVRHPWVPSLWTTTLPGEFRTAHMEYLLAAFGRSGLDAETAHHGFHAVNNHVLGYTMQEQAMFFGFADRDLDSLAEEFLEATPEERFPYTIAHVREHLAGETSSSFELVLDLILDGLRRRSERIGTELA